MSHNPLGDARPNISFSASSKTSSPIWSFLKTTFGFPEIKKLSDALSQDKTFDSRSFLDKLSDEEANTWLKLAVEDICTTSDLDIKAFDEAFDEKKKEIKKLTPEERVTIVAEIFAAIIVNERNQQKQTALIQKIGSTAAIFQEHSKKNLLEQRILIAKSLTCTIAAVFIVSNIVSAITSLTFQLITLAAVGLGGYYAANKVAPDQTAHALAAVNNSGILGTASDFASQGVSATSKAVQKSGIIETLSAATSACMAYVTVNPLTIINMKKQYHDLTGATLGAERLAQLANRYGFKEEVKPNKR